MHGEHGADRHGVAKPRHAFCRRNTHTLIALPTVQLCALAGVVPQCVENWSGGDEQFVLAGGRGKFGNASTEDESTIEIPCDKAVVLEGTREAMCGGSGQTSCLDQSGERLWARLQGVEHDGGLVEDADAASNVHMLIFASQYAKWQDERDREGAPYSHQARTRRQPMGRTLAEKVWEDHVVARTEGEPDLLFIDLHLVHEVTSPQAFDGLRVAGRTVRRPDLTLVTEDHNIPTNNVDQPIADPVSAEQVRVVRKNAEEFGLRIFSMGDKENGIVHVVGPQLGLTQPGMTVVCGDSHTSTHGAFGALAFGIGTSEVEHVLATQTLPLKPFKTMAINVNGKLQPGVTAKDIILAIIAKIGTGGGQGYVLEYRGEAIRDLSMEGRMTICNMSIEAGARAGMIAPDQTTFDYLEGRPHAPTGADWESAIAYWKTLVTDDDAVFDAEVDLDASTLTPYVTWGTNPGQGLPLSSSVPSPEHAKDDVDRVAIERALEYMDLKPGTPLREIPIDTVFLGSCTNGRIEDLRAAANVLKGRKVASSVEMIVVPGSVRVRLQAQEEGLDRIFIDAGADWRFAGCSMCLAMNPDKVAPGKRAASTSNRNFEGRQGPGARTHLVSPQVAAATAVIGRLASPADLEG